jgi:hypothetical protein
MDGEDPGRLISGQYAVWCPSRGGQDQVQELLGRLAALDPDASLGLRVIACFDRHLAELLAADV